MPRPHFQALLLVDGYNVVGAWSELRWIRDQQGLAESRRKLIEILTNYSAYQDYETQIIFDAYQRDRLGSRTVEVITPHLSVHYTDSGQTADTYIEKVCANFRHDLRKFSQRLIVATSDRAQQLTVVGYGAECMSATRLEADVESIVQRVQGRQKPIKKPTGRFLFQSLDRQAQQRLSDLRYGKR